MVVGLIASSLLSQWQDAQHISADLGRRFASYPLDFLCPLPRQLPADHYTCSKDGAESLFEIHPAEAWNFMALVVICVSVLLTYSH